MSQFARPLAIDLFCGAGGMSLGFEQAGFDVLAGFDVEKRHVDVYKKNFPTAQADAVNLAKASASKLRLAAKLGRRPLDVLFGGPPCQGFSFGGKRNIEDERNSLVYHFARLVREFRPRYFVMENVDGLVVGKAHDVVLSFRRRIRSAGYDIVEPIKVLNAAEFGVPQRRRRAFILGFRKGLPCPNYPEPSGIAGPSGDKIAPTVSDAIGDLPLVHDDPTLYASDIYRGALGPASYYAQLLRGDVPDPTDKSTSRPVQAGLSGCAWSRHSAETATRFESIKPGCRDAVSRFFRLDPHGVAPTICAGTDVAHGKHTAPRPIHPEYPRCITVREAARLHGFPDWFHFHSTRWHSFRQIGSSVPPRLARAIAVSLLATLEQGSASQPRKDAHG